MKILILFLSLGFYSLFKNDLIVCQQKKNDYICLIRQAYEQKNYQTFFRLFPDSFSTFIEYYGYVNDSPAPFYFVAYEHLEYLMSGEIDDKLVKKLYAIAKDGVWDADAPNYLQEYLQRLILKHPTIFLREFEKHSNDDNWGFWYFVLYNLYPEQADYKKMYLQLSKSMCTNKEIIALMDSVYRDILSISRE